MKNLFAKEHSRLAGLVLGLVLFLLAFWLADGARAAGAVDAAGAGAGPGASWQVTETPVAPGTPVPAGGDSDPNNASWVLLGLLVVCAMAGLLVWGVILATLLVKLRDRFR